jgi:eukaryotic-like serine/threonine-protein kinase
MSTISGVGVGFSVVGILQPADPRLIGPYRLVGRLGAGGMGRVFLGVSEAGRPVAVKVVHARLAADPEFRARFSIEVAAARKVSGLFTALVVDADVDAPVPWLATAYVAGPSLSEAVRERGPLSVPSLLSLAAGLAKSLTAIHAAGVVHGDLKPSNVLLALDGPRVIDFGISQAAEAVPLARAGLVVGTPSFMSPEQAIGKDVGPLSDVFSLGAVLAFAATGRKPFGTGTAAAVLERVVHGAPSLEDAPQEVRPLIERCLAKDPRQRPSAPALLADVTAAQAAMEPLPGPASQAAETSSEGKPHRGAARRRRPWRPLITASAVAGILAASGAAGYSLNAATLHRPGESALSQAEARMAAKPAGLVPTRAPEPPPPPRITGTLTYQHGRMMYFVILFSDPGHIASGFGFVGTNGSDWPRQRHAFSSPGEGIVEANSIAYPLDQACGTGLEYASDVKAWIYDTAGTRSKPVVIHLICRT